MRRKLANIALLLLAVAVMGLVGAAAVAWASPPVYTECQPCANNRDCGFPKTGLICRDSGFCSSSPFQSCS